MSVKNSNQSVLTPESVKSDLFFQSLALFNLLIICYLLTIGYFNRLALDDYQFVGSLREYGFFSPFTFWYEKWQGRFGPQFMINIVVAIYKVVPNLFFYTISIVGLFIYAFYQILRSVFPISKFESLNYSIFIFGALLLTTFELSTFYWINVSTMYFGGVLFGLLGTVFLLQSNSSLFQYFVIAFCFLYVGSSSEHVGILGCGILTLCILIRLYRQKPVSNFFLNVTNVKLVIAFFFCLIAFVIMILAPGNKVRMGEFQQVTDPLRLIKITAHSSFYILDHIFYKLPYIIFIVPPLILFGATLKEKIHIPRTKLVYVLGGALFGLGCLIYASNLPTAYALGTVGPLRSYVFISFSLIVILFFVCVYVGYYHVSNVTVIHGISIVSVAMLFIFVLYAFWSELPIVVKYNRSDKARIELLKSYQQSDRSEQAIIEPLYKSGYLTITDWFRIVTHTASTISEATDLPLFVGDIGQIPDWRNNQIQYGLALGFPVVLAQHETISKADIDEVKRSAEIKYETANFKFYKLKDYVYYQLDTLGGIPPYIFVRIKPYLNAGMNKKEQDWLIYDFRIEDYRVKCRDSTALKNQLFVKRQVPDFPSKEIETGFYNVKNGTVEYSNQIDLK